MKCPKCKSKHYVKDGIVKKRQRYRCKDCNYRYTVEKRAGEISQIDRYSIARYYNDKRNLYGEVSYREVGRHFKISHVSVRNILKEARLI